MLDASNVELAAVFVHRVGNKLRQEDITFSDSQLRLTKEQQLALLSFFFNHFQKKDDLYRLTHPAGQEQNAVFAIASRCFTGAKLNVESRKAAEHLYDASRHPKIRAGYLYVAHIRGVKLNGIISDALGFFKSDHFEEFIDIAINQESKPSISLYSGTRVKSFDKGALILNCDKLDGFRVLQAVSSSDESVFWTDRFLQTEEVPDTKTHTRDLLNACKKFSKNIGSSEKSPERVIFLQSAYAYLSETDKYEKSNFLTSLPASQRDEFDAYLETHKSSDQGSLPSKFKVDSTFLAKSKTSFRSTIKLDNKIEIRIDAGAEDSDHRMIERGYDSKLKKNFYKIFFNTES